MLIPIYLTKWEITNDIIGHQCRATHGWYRMHIHQKSHSSYSKRYSSLGLKQYYPQFLKRSALLSLKEIETFHSHIFLPTYEMRAAAFVTSSHRGQQNAAKIQPLHHKTEHLPPSNNEMQKKSKQFSSLSSLVRRMQTYNKLSLSPAILVQPVPSL